MTKPNRAREADGLPAHGPRGRGVAHGPGPRTVTADARAEPAADRSASVFISYAREDSEFARLLYDALAAQRREVWADWEGILPGATWDAEIARGIEEADAFVFVLSPDSVTSIECGRELTRAVEHAKRLFPLLYRAVEPVDAPAPLQTVQWTDFREERAFDAAFESLSTGIDTDLGWVRQHTRVLGRALEWDASARDRAFLLRGRDLTASEQWLGEQTPVRQPTELQATYVHASRLAATRRQRVTVGAILFALVVAVALSILSVIKSRQAAAQAKVARARELATSAVSQFSADPELGVLLATEAAGIRPLPQVVDVLREALFHSSLRSVLRTKDGDVYNPRFSPDGRLLLATVNTGAPALVWSLASGKLVARPGARGREVLDASFSPNGRRVVTAESDGSARLWDTKTWRAVGVLPGGVLGIGETPFSADGTEALTFGRGTATSVWKVATGTRIAVLRPRKSASSTTLVAAAFTPDGRRVLTVSDDGVVREWDVAAERVVSTWRGPTNYVESARFSRDRERVVLVRGDAALAWLWRFRSAPRWPSVVRTGRRYSPSWFSTDLTLRAEQTEGGIRVVRQANSQTIRELPVPIGGGPNDATFSPSNKLVATSGLNEVRIWSIGGLDPVATLSAGSARVAHASFAPNGKLVLTVGGGVARIWPLVPRRPPIVVHPGGRKVAAAAFSRDGESLVVAGEDGAARVLGAASASVRAMLPGHAPLLAVAFAPNGDVVTIDECGVARRWDASRGRVVAESRKPFELGRGCALSEEGSHAAAISEDGALVATSALSRPVVWRVADGKTIGRFGFYRGTGSVYGLALSPDSKLVVNVGGEAAARVWEVASGKTIAELVGSAGEQLAAAFSPDGQLVVTAGVGAPVVVWAVSTGRMIATLNAPPGSGDVTSVGFSSDGTQIVTAGSYGTARIYACEVCRSTSALIALARKRATRSLTPQERQTYLHEPAQ